MIPKAVKEEINTRTSLYIDTSLTLKGEVGMAGQKVRKQGTTSRDNKYIPTASQVLCCDNVITVVSRASAHSRVNAHVPHFKGSM